MASESVVAIRYAKALAEYAVEEGQVKEVRDDLEALADLLDPYSGDLSIPELLDFLQTPVMTRKAKLDITDVILEAMGIGTIVSNFLNVLIIHNRVSAIPHIVASYNYIVGGLTDEYTATILTARALTDEQKDKISTALTRCSGKNIRVIQHIEPSLISGVQIHLGNKLIDSSVLGHLNRLNEQLAKF